MLFRCCRAIAVVAVLGASFPVMLHGQAAAVAQSTQAQGKTQSIAEKIAASKGLLDINTATAEELKALPGMGVVYVQRVIAGRPYAAKNQLVQRGVLPEDEYLKIKEYIIAHRVKK
jgi:competence protein ComEA